MACGLCGPMSLGFQRGRCSTQCSIVCFEILYTFKNKKPCIFILHLYQKLCRQRGRGLHGRSRAQGKR